MNPNNPTSNPTNSPTGNLTEEQREHIHNPLSVMSADEKIVCEIKRHPFGMFAMYFMFGMALIVLLAAAIVAPHYIPDLSADTKAAFMVVALFASVLAIMYLYIAGIIYSGNSWIVTSDSITQISQTGLFTKQTSQLSLANLEDVTFEQNSLLQTALGFGILKVETAGERSKFAFAFCPNPDHYAKLIIQAHDEFMRTHSEDGTPLSLQTNTSTYANAPMQQPPSGPVSRQ